MTQLLLWLLNTQHAQLCVKLWMHTQLIRRAYVTSHTSRHDDPSPLLSLWRSSCRWSPGRCARGRCPHRWPAPPSGWSPWTPDPPGTRSCAGRGATRLGLGPGAAAARGCVRDSRPADAPRSPACLQIRPGDWSARRDRSWNRWNREAERPAGLSRPWRRRESGGKGGITRDERLFVAVMKWCGSVQRIANKQVTWQPASGKRRGSCVIAMPPANQRFRSLFFCICTCWLVRIIPPISIMWQSTTSLELMHRQRQKCRNYDCTNK